MSTHARCHVIGLAVAIGLLTLLACTLPGQAGPQAAGTKPTVTIIEPAPGTQVTPGTAVAVRFMAVDASGIARVELLVDNASANSQVAPQPVSAYQGTFTWIATTPGPHALLVRATNTAGATSDPAVVSVLVTEAGLLPAPTAGGPLATVAPPPVATQPSVSTLRVAPDGSGDYPTLAAAVAAAPAGATIQLAAGTYNLTQPLDVAKPLRLTGAGMDATSVVGQTGEYVVRFTGPGTLTAEGITFRYAGTTWARVMVIKDGEVDLVRCRFTGAVRDSATEKGGTGLWLQGDTRGQVRECRAESNGLHGIYVQDQAQPTLEGNICTGNDYTGIVYFDDASGVARQNECSDNKAHGISVNNQAQPTLEENICQDNAECGIYYTGSSSGVARQNECSGNKWGIYVQETANPVLVDNNCHDNSKVNIEDKRSAQTPKPTTGPASPTESPTSAVLTGQIAFPALNADRVHYDIWIVNADGSNLHRVVEKMRQPCLRPDGLLLVANGEAHFEEHLITMKPDGSEHQPVSQHVEDSHPSWSPDGRRLVYDTTAAPGGGWQICIVDNPAARQWHALSGPGGAFGGLHGQYPTWMPDGRIIFKTSNYWGDDTQGGLYVVSEGGGMPTQVTRSGHDTAPAMHGSTVAFMSIRSGGDYEIYTANVSGALDDSLKQLTDNNAQDGLPTWSPNGQYIAFVSDEGGAWGLWVMRADGTGRHKLLALPSPLGGDWGDERVSWAP